MKYRYLAPEMDPEAVPATRLGRVVLVVIVLVVGMVLVVSVARWAIQPDRITTDRTTLDAWNERYGCGPDAVTKPVQLTAEERRLIEEYVGGPVVLPMKTTGCKGLPED